MGYATAAFSVSPCVTYDLWASYFLVTSVASTFGPRFHVWTHDKGSFPARSKCISSLFDCKTPTIFAALVRGFPMLMREILSLNSASMTLACLEVRKKVGLSSISQPQKQKQTSCQEDNSLLRKLHCTPVSTTTRRMATMVTEWESPTRKSTPTSTRRSTRSTSHWPSGPSGCLSWCSSSSWAASRCAEPTSGESARHWCHYKERQTREDLIMAISLRLAPVASHSEVFFVKQEWCF